MTNIGQLITDKQEKDAIHIAVIPVTATTNLMPGEHVKLVPGTQDTVTDIAHDPDYSKAIGVVDPFLRQSANVGSRFWLFLLPNTITSLRHDWTHPLFQDKTEAIKWLEYFAEENYLTYDELLQAAKDYIEYDDLLCDGGKWEGCYTPDEFWNHYQTVTGELIPEDKRGNFFNCSC